MINSSKNWAELQNHPNPPNKTPNRDRRPREYLSSDEVSALAKSALDGRYGFRDFMLIMTAYRHGLRVSEVTSLEWRDVNLEDNRSANMIIHRSKGGRTVSHPVEGNELKELRKLKRLYPGQYLFQSERKQKLSRRAVNDILYRACERIDFPFKVSSHMLRHSRGYLLANKNKDIRQIQTWLGHKSIASTQIYTELAHETLKGLGADA